MGENVAINFSDDGLPVVVEQSNGDKHTTNTTLLSIMIAMVAVFAIVEFVGGVWSGSLALLSDAFHMMSDLGALVVGLVATRLALRESSPGKSYGWKRAEIVGAFANGVFLLSICFFILLEATQRFITPTGIEQPWIVFGVGVAGLIINVIGVLMFCAHGHGHGHGHGHSLNMHGIFLHVLGDALGSIVVIAVALLSVFVEQQSFRFIVYLDPACSVILALFIGKSAFTLTRRTANILMQSTPPHVDLVQMEKDMLGVDGVIGVHALHVWQMTESESVGSVHVSCLRSDAAVFERICNGVKTIMHKNEVHKTAVQPDFVDSQRHLIRRQSSRQSSCHNNDNCCFAS